MSNAWQIYEGAGLFPCDLTNTLTTLPFARFGKLRRSLASCAVSHRAYASVRANERKGLRFHVHEEMYVGQRRTQYAPSRHCKWLAFEFLWMANEAFAYALLRYTLQLMLGCLISQCPTGKSKEGDTHVLFRVTDGYKKKFSTLVCRLVSS